AWHTEMRAAKYLPEVVKGAKWARIAKNQQVEPAVVVERIGDERKAQGVARCVEYEHRGAGQDFRNTVIFDAHGDSRELVGEAGAKHRTHICDPGRGPDPARKGNTRMVVACHDVAVEAKSRHQQKSAPHRRPDVDVPGTAFGYCPGQGGGAVA